MELIHVPVKWVAGLQVTGTELMVRCIHMSVKYGDRMRLDVSL